MDNAQLAIIISVASAAIAAISLGWNIYRDVILKPKAVVSVARKNIVGPGIEPSPDYIGISATNHGPGPIILNTVVLRNTSLLKKITKEEGYAVLIHDYENLHSSRMPAKLDVGESVNLFVTYDLECFLSEDYTELGISDSFGRTNWAPKKSMKELRKKWLAEFEQNT